MKKIFKKTEFTDKEGKKVRKVFGSGLVETILVEPSQWYKDNVQKPMQEQAQKRKKEMEKSQKIAEKMRDMAIKELEKDGEL